MPEAGLLWGLNSETDTLKRQGNVSTEAATLLTVNGTALSSTSRINNQNRTSVKGCSSSKSTRPLSE